MGFKRFVDNLDEKRSSNIRRYQIELRDYLLNRLETDRLKEELILLKQKFLFSLFSPLSSHVQIMYLTCAVIQILALVFLNLKSPLNFVFVFHFVLSKGICYRK